MSTYAHAKTSIKCHTNCIRRVCAALGVMSEGNCGESGSSERLSHLINPCSGLRQPQDGGLSMQRGPWHTVGLRLKDATGCNTTLSRLGEFLKKNNSWSVVFFPWCTSRSSVSFNLIISFLKRIFYHNFLMSQGCRRLSLLGSERGQRARGLTKIIIWRLTQSICFVSVQSIWSLTTYCESGAQNDHIIFLIHVVSPPLPSRPLFALRNEGYWRKEMPVSPQTGELALCLCPTASNGSFKVKYYLLIIRH